jgi:hypothetical protein
MVVAAENWVQNFGVGRWQMMEELRVESPAVKTRLSVCSSEL